MMWTGRGLALLAAMAVGTAPAAAATTYTVSGTADPPGATCTGTVCTSLRAAVTNVPVGSTIQLGTGIYKVNGVLAIGQSEAIAGVSPSQTTIEQTKAGDGVIEATAGDLSLSGLTITGGTKLGANGLDPHAGGIFSAGSSLTLGHVSVTHNTATGSSAPGANGGDAVGGIQIDGASTALTISNSSITNNTATGGTGASAVGSGNGKPGGTAYGALADFAVAPTIMNTVISGNTATGGAGGTASGGSGFTGGMSGQTDGAITIIAHPASSTTLITGSTIANNTTIGGRAGNGVGNGVNMARGGDGNTVYGALTGGGNTIKIVSSTISGNTGRPATGGTGSTHGSPGSVLGGGIGLTSGDLTVVNSTVATNVVSGHSGEGGAIEMISGGTLLLASDTIFGNSAPVGGNLDVSGGQFWLASTIIAGGVGTQTGATPSGNCLLDTVTETDFGHNLESSAPPQCGLSPGKSDLSGGSPQLAALAANGGPTQTMALGPLSPAIGNGGNCGDISIAGSPSLATDERGLPRVSPCDIGAFEHQPIVQQPGPGIFGSATFGSKLTCSPGVWSGDGIAYRYQWSRNARRIAGETEPTHLVAALDFGTVLSCAVTVTGTYGQATANASVTMPPNCNCTPKLTKVSQSHRRWRRGTRLGRLSAVAARPPVGTTFTFTLDRAANVTLSFTRSSSGRVVRGRCVALTPVNRHSKSCTLTKGAGTVTFKGHRGVNRISFQGRLSKRKRLATGSYLLGVTAALTGGPASRPSTLRFSVVG
jgi:hypothetical protein